MVSSPKGSGGGEGGKLEGKAVVRIVLWIVCLSALVVVWSEVWIRQTDQRIGKQLEQEEQWSNPIWNMEAFQAICSPGTIVFECTPEDVQCGDQTKQQQWIRRFEGLYNHSNLILYDENVKDVRWFHLTPFDENGRIRSDGLQPVWETLEDVFERFQQKGSLLLVFRPPSSSTCSSTHLLSRIKQVLHDRDQQYQWQRFMYHCCCLVWSYLYTSTTRPYRFWFDWWHTRPSRFQHQLLEDGYTVERYSIQRIR